jgi:hypothetical protein
VKHEDSIGSMSEQEEFDKKRQYALQEEAHYHTTIHHVVLLMEEVGYLKVLDDIMKQYNNTLKDKKPS